MSERTGNPAQPKNVINIEYEPNGDILNIYLQNRETPLKASREREGGTILNYAADGSLALIEILDASAHFEAGQLAAHSVDQLIDLRKAAEMTGIAPITLRIQVIKGRLWAIRAGGKWMTTRERLQKYLNSRYKVRKGKG
jgi:uncharacterized protein YuzE